MASIAATSTIADMAARTLAGGVAGLRITMDAPGHASVALPGGGAGPRG